MTRRDVDWDRLTQEYIDGKDAVALASQYRVHSSIIYSHLEKMGIDRRRSGDVRRRYHFNERYFCRLDSANSCYWLGFLFADGSISEVSNALRVNLQASDAAHLQALLMDLETTSHQVKYKVTSGHSVAGIAITSLYLRQDLASWGMAQPKNERQIPPMPQQFKRHFIRGYFDGDGSISVHGTLKREDWKASIVSTSHSMVGQIASAILEVAIPCSIYSPTNTNLWYLSIGGNQVKRFGQWLYTDASRYLTRKKERFDELL
jgi:DNA-binding transcriptional regulator WhiA